MPLVRVGKLLKPHGVHGQIKCALTTDHPELIAARDGYWLFDERSKELIPLKHPEFDMERGMDSFLLRAAGWTSPEQVAAFNGCALLYVAKRGELPREPGGVYYFELAGLEVRDPSGKVLGRVKDIIETGASIVLDLDCTPPRVIPFTARDVPEVNLEQGYLVTTYGAEIRGRAMKFHVITIFPDFVRSVFEFGVVRRGVEAGVLEHNLVDLRDSTHDKHRSTDDSPFGGGPGMVMRCEPVFECVEALRAAHGPLPLIYLSPAGEKLTHELAVELAQGGDVILLCGRYEGLDQRVIDELVDREISIGDYVLSGGELPAMVLIDAVARQVPGVLGNDCSPGADSFATGLLDWPHYTRPEVYRDLAVPPVLLSGHHAQVAEWRRKQALLLTYERRPELLTEEQRTEAEKLQRAEQG